MSMVCSRYTRFLLSPLLFCITFPAPLRSQAQWYEGKRIVDIQFNPSESDQPLAAADSDPVGDIDGSVEYKRKMVRVFVRRALRQALAMPPAG